MRAGDHPRAKKRTVSLIDLDAALVGEALHLFDRPRVLELVLLRRVPKPAVVDRGNVEVLGDPCAVTKRGYQQEGRGAKEENEERVD